MCKRGYPCQPDTELEDTSLLTSGRNHDILLSCVQTMTRIDLILGNSKSLANSDIFWIIKRIPFPFSHALSLKY